MGGVFCDETPAYTDANARAHTRTHAHTLLVVSERTNKRHHHHLQLSRARARARRVTKYHENAGNRKAFAEMKTALTRFFAKVPHPAAAADECARVRVSMLPHHTEDTRTARLATSRMQVQKLLDTGSKDSRSWACDAGRNRTLEQIKTTRETGGRGGEGDGGARTEEDFRERTTPRRLSPEGAREIKASSANLDLGATQHDKSVIGFAASSNPSSG